jgi:outer membrane protein assembly factor BamE (lipoprotein component of BamABCDE complex)
MRHVQGKLAMIAVLSAGILQGCATPTSLEKQMSDMRAAQEGGDTLSVAKVQREISVGMSSSDVVSILGSPNMVTTDDQRRESWVYDKVSTEAMATTSQGFSFFLLPQNAKGAVSSTQKTLTIVIKFDNDGKVRDYAYHQTKF